MKLDIFKQLNSQQIETVKYIDGPSVILAGAGSGKTRVLVSKVIYLIEEKNTDPHLIVMITFTNKAANEMKERIERYFKSQVCLGFIGTFHSFCANILRRNGANIEIERNFNIYDENDQLGLIKHILKKLESKKYSASYVLYKISSAKNLLIEPKKYQEVFSDYEAEFISQIYQQYQQQLKKNKAVDFDDLLMMTVNLFIKAPAVLEKYQKQYRFFFIDEYQDTNYAQYVLTRMLGYKYRQLTVVGDFSQSIYSWRGADIRNLEKLQEDFPETKVFHLEENYRSPQTILDFAYNIISKNRTHPILKLYTKNNQGEEITYYQAGNEQDEAIYLASEIQKLSQDNSLSSFAVLYRTNAQSRVIEEAFLHFGLPYLLIGGTRFYERKEVKDVLSYLRLIVNPKDTIALERIKKLGQRRWQKFTDFYHKGGDRKAISTNELIEKIFQETDYLTIYNPDDPEDFSRLENIKELRSVAINFPDLTGFLEQVALVESEYFEGEKKANKDGVRLMTLHQAKGLEFPYVFIVGVEDGLLPHSQAVNDLFELEEERRLFYVGITRAKKKLYITYTRKRFIFGRRIESIRSRFLDDGDMIY